MHGKQLSWTRGGVGFMRTSCGRNRTPGSASPLPDEFAGSRKPLNTQSTPGIRITQGDIARFPPLQCVQNR